MPLTSFFFQTENKMVFFSISTFYKNYFTKNKKQAKIKKSNKCGDQAALPLSENAGRKPVKEAAGLYSGEQKDTDTEPCACKEES